MLNRRIQGPILGHGCSALILALGLVSEFAGSGGAFAADCNLNGASDDCEIAQGAVSFKAGRASGGADVFGDFDGDGDLDAAAFERRREDDPGRSVTIQLNDGSGKFCQASRVDEVDDPTVLASGDWDGDGDVDLVAAIEDESRVRLLENDGRAQFTLGRLLDLPASWLLPSDLDHDGDVDLIAIRHFEDPGFPAAQLLLNDGSGMFRLPGSSMRYSTGPDPRFPLLADLDGDEHVDLLVANGSDGMGHVSEQLSILPGLESGGFGDRTTVAVGGEVYFPAALDLDEDGDLDLAVSAYSRGEVRLLRNLGGFAFEPAGSLDGFQGAGHLASGLLAGNDIPDLVLSDPFAMRTVILRRGPPFQLERVFEIHAEPVTHLLDLNGDGSRDLVAGGYLFLNQGGGSFLAASTFHSGSSISSGSSLVSADFEGDRDPDLALLSGAGQAVSILLNDGAGALILTQFYPTDDASRVLLAGDIDGDTRVDLIYPGLVETQLSTLLALADGTFQLGQDLNTQVDTEEAALGDLDGDGDLDLVGTGRPSTGGRVLFVLKNYGEGAFGDSSTISFPDAGGPILVARMDADMDLDVIVGVRSFPPFVVLKNDGTGGFGPAPMVDFDPIPGFVLAAGDLDGDGDVDVATAETERSDLSIWSNSGDGDFSFAAGPEVIESTTGLALADIDGDERLDVLRSGPGVGILRNLDGFSFASEVLFEPDPLSYGIVSRDYDLDGKADIAVAPFSIDRVMVLYNTSPPAPPRDLDRDGVLDDCQEAFFRRGDANANGQVNLADTVFLLASLFVGGTDPPCLSSADLNDSGTLDITDPIYILEFLFLGSAAPPAPYERCGPDPTPDALDCGAFPACGR